MKAIIMAGGEGQRLRPISHGCPKPMVRLMGKPIMEHTIRLLQKHGFTEICVTLCSQPEAITSYFGDGSAFGVEICYREELEPMGTAGGVRNCADFTGQDDVLIISGDAACDFDLTTLINNHQASAAAVTIALTETPDPLKYGLVVTDLSGEVVSFIEKPDWSRVVTDLVNTGIYVLSPLAVELIPEGEKFDFAKDLFPMMMDMVVPIRASVMDGYWCDIGNSEEFLRCSMDALNGKLRLSESGESISPGIRCASKIPASVKLRTPCFIAEDVIIGEGAEIGPEAVISPGSVIGTQAKIRASVVDGAEIGADCLIEGSVICRGAQIKPGQAVTPGSIIGAPGAENAPKRSPLASRRGKEGKHIAEIACTDKAHLMRMFSESLMEAGADFSDGLIIERSGGKVRLSPSSQSSCIVIESLSGTGADIDIAESCKRLSEDFQ